MQKNKQISIIIPSYNEESRIESCILTLLDFCKTNLFIIEIIIVDDGSIDKTMSILSKYEHDLKVIHYKKNRGKGYAVKQGMLFAKGDAVIFMDTDLSTPLNEIQKLCSFSSDVVIGSRKKDIPRQYPIRQSFRRTISDIGSYFRKIFLLRTINDTQCGFKYFSKKACGCILAKSTIDGYAFDIEFLTISKDNHLSITEIGVIWSHNSTGHLENPYTIIKAIYHITTSIVVVYIKSVLGLYTEKKSKL